LTTILQGRVFQVRLSTFKPDAALPAGLLFQKFSVEDVLYASQAISSIFGRLPLPLKDPSVSPLTVESFGFLPPTASPANPLPVPRRRSRLAGRIFPFSLSFKSSLESLFRRSLNHPLIGLTGFFLLRSRACPSSFLSPHGPHSPSRLTAWRPGIN